MLLISTDSKYLFSVDESRLNVFSIQTGELVHKLGHSNLPIQSICISPLNKFQLLTFHSGGKICIWDYEDGLMLKTLETSLNVKKIVCINSSVYAVASSDEREGSEGGGGGGGGGGGENEDEGGSMIGRFSLYKLELESGASGLIGKQLVLKGISLNLEKFQIDISTEESYLACLEGRKHLSIYEFGRDQLNKKFNAKMDLTCLAVHPKEDCIATGTSTGKIVLWYNYLACMREKNKVSVEEADEDVEELMQAESNVNGNGNGPDSDETDSDDEPVSSRKMPKKSRNSTATKPSPSTSKKPALLVTKPTKSILHWHSLPVISLRFTPEGSFLLSGGHECVLVKWFYKTGQKDFRPRLGSPISQIVSSVDNTLYATRHLDNTVHLLSANLNVVQTIAPFICPNNIASVKPSQQSTASLYPAGLAFFPALNCIVTNGKPGHLQFYAHSTEKLLFNLDVVEENYISPENLNKPLVHTQIECVSVNESCEWLATAERRADGSTTPDVKLKIWSFDRSTRKFTLNTLVKYPHSFERVTRLKFKPGTEDGVLFSAGDDSCIKSWALRRADDSNSPFSWVYLSSNGYRDLNPVDFDFLRLNSDSRLFVGRSLCSVAFSHILTVWMVDVDGSLVFLNDMMHCDANDPVREVRCVRTAGTNLVVAVHARSVNVWRLSESDEEAGLRLDAHCLWSRGNLNVLATHGLPDVSEMLLFDGGDVDGSNAVRMFKMNLNVTRVHRKGREVDETVVDVKMTEARQHRLTSPAQGPLNLICLPSSAESGKMEVFYCDNRGIFNRMFDEENRDVELSDQMWSSREKAVRNLPESSLARLLAETGKAAAAAAYVNGEVDFIDEARNPEFEANFRKIETTPAYLLPKVSSYCYSTLKSLLLKNY